MDSRGFWRAGDSRRRQRLKEIDLAQQVAFYGGREDEIRGRMASGQKFYELIEGSVWPVAVLRRDRREQPLCVGGDAFVPLVGSKCGVVLGEIRRGNRMP